MESTSVYWTTIFSILQEAGIEVCLVTPKKFRMVPGRKTDITGKTGTQIIEAILKGERDPKVLASFRDPCVKKSEEEIIEALTGYYKEDQLYLLKINYQFYCFFDKQLNDLDKQITLALKRFPLKKEKKEKRADNAKSTAGGKNDIRTKENLEDILFHILGVDLSSLPGIRANAILQIISEVGTDMSKFPSAKHFASYLGFVPHNKITGGHIISARTDRIKNSAAQAFRKLIPFISQTKTALGAFYRRLAPGIGKAQVITATCRKLAILAKKYGCDIIPIVG